jgi:hypothetical protein
MDSHDSLLVPSPPAQDENVPPPNARKAVLFCPDCEYDEPVDGDWVERDDRTAGVRELNCPNCAATVTSRPLPADSEATTPSDENGLLKQVDAWGSLWASTLRFWSTTLEPVQVLKRAN